MVEKHEVFEKKYWSASDLKKPVTVEIETVNVEVLKASGVGQISSRRYATIMAGGLK